MFEILLAIQYFSIFILFIESAYIFIKWRTRLQGLLLFTCAVTFINNFGYLFEMLSHTESEYLMGLKMSYVGRIFIPFALFLFTMKLCNKPIKKRLATVLCAVHLITFFLVFTCESNDLYYTTMEYVEDGWFAYLKCGHGVWYIAYQILIVSYIFIGLINLFISAKREKNTVVKKRLYTVTLSIAIESLFFILGLTTLAGCYDMTMIGYTIGAVVMCIGIFKFDLLDTLEIAKEFVIDEIPEGILIFNQDGKLEYTNNVATSIFVDKKSSEIKQLLEHAIENEEPITINERIYSPDKKLLNHKGADRGIVYMLIDDTEHYLYMNELKTQKELAENAREEAIAASESKSQFLSIVSHEIRTPMNAVVGMTELLLREPENLNEKQEKYLMNIKNSGSALVMIVNDILDQSKIEAGKMEIVEEPYELRPMISDIKMIIENRIGSKPIHLIMEIEDNVPKYLVGDSLRIRQIVINLMNNAVKFTESGYISLNIKSVARKDNSISLRFSVKDSGQGIKPEDLSKLGEAFSQVDTKKNHKKEGTGLGLSISKNFINMMGGQLEVASVYGEGSEFFFTISQGIAEGIEITNASGVQKQAWQEEEKFTCKNARILVVDDTEINLMIMKEMLKPLLLTTDTAASGKEAVEMVSKCRYDAIFMDYMMPFMDGVEATKEIRKLSIKAENEGDRKLAQYYKNVPIIALTGDDSPETKEQFKRAGIDDFIEKPVVIKRVKKLLLKWLPIERINSEIQ